MNILQSLSPDVIFLVILAVVPSAAWFFLFYRKDPTPIRLRTMIFTFLIGCFSVVPLFVYQKIYTEYRPELSAFIFVQNFAANLVLQGFLDFMVAIVFLAIFLLVLTAIITLVVTLFYKETFKNVWRAMLIEATNFSAFGIMIALVIVINTTISTAIGQNVFTSTLGLFLILAVMEEYVKHLIVRFTDDHRIRDIDDAIEMSLVVGLAFAFVENIVYFMNFRDQLWVIFVGRSVFSLFAHIFFSGIFGFYYGTAHFAKYIYFLRARVSGEIFQLPRAVHKILHLKSAVTYQEQKLMEGLVFSTVIHTIFNLFLENNWTFLIVPYLLGGYLLLSYLLSYKEDQKQYGLIGSRAMPYSDFQRLAWKISAIRWAAEIKAAREHPVTK